MSVTIGLVANVFNEANALPGWLEVHTPYFDDIRVLHAGPQGVYSDDGTIELLEKWRVPVEFCAIDEGFGVVRSRALRMCPCDYVVLLDADERFYPLHRVLHCAGNSTPHSEADEIIRNYDFRDGKLPDWKVIARLGKDLHVSQVTCYDQGARLREILETERPDAVAAIRRHWHDLSFRRPTQNWHTEPDWQMRILRNHPSIHFDTGTRMHERLVGAGNVYRADMDRGPFFDHFHFFMKKLEMGQRAHDVAVYDAIHEGRKPPTWDEFKVGRGP